MLALSFKEDKDNEYMIVAFLSLRGMFSKDGKPVVLPYSALNHV